MINCDRDRSEFIIANDDLSIFEKLLLDFEEMQEWSRTSSNDEHEMKEFNNNLECIVKNDHNNIVNFESSEGKIQDECISFICRWKRCWHLTKKWMTKSDDCLKNHITQHIS